MASNTRKPVIIDGSYLEGGGQILRVSTALSVLLNKPIEIVKIRAGRKDGGLKPQHLTGIKLLAQISKASLSGDTLKSTQVCFDPSDLHSDNYVADTQTAGSVCLLIQSALPCLLFAKKESTLLLRGGTNAENAPQIDYFTMVFSPLASKFGINVECEIHKRGYYPQGRGEVYLKVHSVDHLKPIEMVEFGKLKRFYARSFVAGFLNVKIAERMSETVREKLAHCYPNVPYEADIVKEPQHNHIGAGTGIIVIAETTTGCLIAGSALGKKGVPAEQVGQEAVDSLLEDLKCEACVDQYMQDQLIIFMSLAAGTSRVKTGPLTLHTRTAIHFTEFLTGAKFKIDAQHKDYFIIECEGIGHEGKKLANSENNN